MTTLNTLWMPKNENSAGPERPLSHLVDDSATVGDGRERSTVRLAVLALHVACIDRVKASCLCHVYSVGERAVFCTWLSSLNFVLCIRSLIEYAIRQ